MPFRSGPGTARETRRAHTVIAAVWALLGVLMLALAACDPADGASAHSAANDSPANSTSHHPADHDSMGHATHGGMEHTELAAMEPSDFSVYHAEADWTDQHGVERQLTSLAGRVQVVAMLYTNCAFACPRIMLDMKRIEGELGPGLRDEVGFVVVSIDPERDTPEQLAQFARGSKLDPERWTLLHGDEGDILELAALLGVQYRETSPGEWVHSNLITVLDPEGEIVHRQLGLGTDPTETLAAIRSASGRTP